MEAFEIARINMVKNQILPANVTNEALLDVIMSIPRQIFIPEDKQGISYIDGSLQLGHNRYMLPPMIFAKMIEELDIQGTESVLDIACGTGYSSVVLANLCRKVVAVESKTDLASKAHLNLNKLGIGNVIIISDFLADGHFEGSPYNIIFINGAITAVPQNIFDQLGQMGKLVAIISKSHNSGSIVLYQKINDSIISNEIFDVNLPVIEDF